MECSPFIQSKIFLINMKNSQNLTSFIKTLLWEASSEAKKPHSNNNHQINISTKLRLRNNIKILSTQSTFMAMVFKEVMRSRSIFPIKEKITTVIAEGRRSRLITKSQTFKARLKRVANPTKSFPIMTQATVRSSKIWFQKNRIWIVQESSKRTSLDLSRKPLET